MAASGERLDVRYCEGWDPHSRAMVAPLPIAAVRHRDVRGEQYAVLLGIMQRPRVLIEVSWQHHYAAVWFFDGLLRRAAKHEFRRLTGDRLFLVLSTEWQYTAPEQVEFDATAHVRSRRLSPDGTGLQTDRYPPGSQWALQETSLKEPVDRLWEPVPRFGDWASLARRNRDQPLLLALVEHPGPEADVQDGDAGLPPERRPWRPPVPLQPSDLDAMFRPGMRYALPGGNKADKIHEVVVEVRQAGQLQLSSGRLVVADPAWLDTTLEPFTVAVDPGVYPVILAVIRFKDGPAHRRVAAARLLVRTEPVATWELALRPGQDPRMLGDNELFGFAVDSGTACLHDAAATAVMAGMITDAAWDGFVDAHGDKLLRNYPVEVIDPGSGANLIAFQSGWGDGYYPTWIGRTAAGQVAGFVADMLVLHGATLLP
jgi:Protein of unknown function (DUF4241)